VTSPARFRQQMKWLRENGYRAVTLDDAVGLMQNASPQRADRTVAITFDDGFHDFRLNAWPVLCEFGFVATMFVPTLYIRNTRKSFRGRECLTWREVRELSTSGVSFGSHTVSHPVLYRLPWPEVRRELWESRLQLESELDRPVTAFAYPYAFPQEDKAFCARLREELCSQGYRVATTTEIGHLQLGIDPLRVPRLPVNDCDDQRLFLSKLNGAYDWVRSVQFLSRTARRVREWTN
jgi:hypothetical protein